MGNDKTQFNVSGFRNKPSPPPSIPAHPHHWQHAPSSKQLSRNFGHRDTLATLPSEARIDARTPPALLLPSLPPKPSLRLTDTALPTVLASFRLRWACVCEVASEALSTNDPTSCCVTCSSCKQLRDGETL